MNIETERTLTTIADLIIYWNAFKKGQARIVREYEKKLMEK